MIDNKKFLRLKGYFQDLINKVNPEETITMIKASLQALTGIKIAALEVNTKPDRFGVNVFPTKEEMNDKIIKYLTSMRYIPEVVGEVVIEIDGLCMFDPRIALTAGELTAMVLHELFYTTNTFSCLNDIKYIFTRTLFYFSDNNDGIVMLDVFKKECKNLMFLLYPAFIETYVNNDRDRSSYQDDFVVDYDCSEELYSGWKKLEGVIARPKTAEELGTLYKLFINYILNFSTDRKKIVETLQSCIKDLEGSEYITNLLNEMINRIEHFDGSLVKSPTEDNIDRYLEESFKTFVETRKRGMSDLEISELELEIQNIQYASDKHYLVERIHRDISICNSYVIKHNITGKDRQFYDDYVRRLQELKDAVIEKRIVDKDYNIRVIYDRDIDYKYGEGY